jgi:hypothetical protein
MSFVKYILRKLQHFLKKQETHTYHLGKMMLDQNFINKNIFFRKIRKTEKKTNKQVVCFRESPKTFKILLFMKALLFVKGIIFKPYG